MFKTFVSLFSPRMAGMQLEQEVTRRVEAHRAMLEVRLQQVLVRVNAVRDQETEALCLELDEAKAYSTLMVEWVRPHHCRRHLHPFPLRASISF